MKKENVLREIKHHHDNVKSRFKAIDKALTLQAGKYNSRLDQLNHIHSRFQEERLFTLPREIHEKFEEDVNKKFSVIDIYIANNRGKNYGIAMVVSGIGSILAIILAIVSLWR